MCTCVRVYVVGVCFFFFVVCCCFTELSKSNKKRQIARYRTHSYTYIEFWSVTYTFPHSFVRSLWIGVYSDRNGAFTCGSREYFVISAFQWQWTDLTSETDKMIKWPILTYFIAALYFHIDSFQIIFDDWSLGHASQSMCVSRFSVANGNICTHKQVKDAVFLGFCLVAAC